MYEIFEQLMKEKGVNASEVSRATGISRSNFTDWKKGRSTPKAEKLQLIADYFDVPLETFTSKRKKKIVAVFHKKNSVHSSLANPDRNISTPDLFYGKDYFKEKVMQEVMKAIDDNTPSGYPVYYTDPETAQLAQEVFDNPDLRILFSAARDAKPEDIKLAADMLRRFKETNPDG